MYRVWLRPLVSTLAVSALVCLAVGTVWPHVLLIAHWFALGVAGIAAFLLIMASARTPRAACDADLSVRAVVKAAEPCPSLQMTTSQAARGMTKRGKPATNRFQDIDVCEVTVRATELSSVARLADRYDPFPGAWGAGDEQTRFIVVGDTDVFEQTGRELGYWAGYFRRSLTNNGAVFTAKRLLEPRSGEASQGLHALRSANRLDLSVAADDAGLMLDDDEELAPFWPRTQIRRSGDFRSA